MNVSSLVTPPLIKRPSMLGLALDGLPVILQLQLCSLVLTPRFLGGELRHAQPPMALVREMLCDEDGCSRYTRTQNDSGSSDNPCLNLWRHRASVAAKRLSQPALAGILCSRVPEVSPDCPE